MSHEPLVASIHALDMGGGEGIVADAAVFGELSCQAAWVATALAYPEALPPALLERQLARLLARGPIGAARVGFVEGAAQVEAIARCLARVAPGSSVLAPILRVDSEIADPDTRAAITRELYPLATVVVVRSAELPLLLGRDPDDLDALRDAANRLRDRGARAVLIAGWSAHGRVLDLVDDGGKVVLLDTARIHASHVAGLAGSHAAALAAHLARGLSLREAAAAAQRYVAFRIMRGR